jgi:recombination protein RecA
LIDLGVTNGLLEKSGTWISYKNERLGQGRENARVFLKENIDIRAKIEHDLRKALGLLAHPAAPADGNGKPSAEAQKLAAADAAAKQPPKAAAATASSQSRSGR